jgi:hypothetical protein
MLKSKSADGLRTKEEVDQIRAARIKAEIDYEVYKESLKKTRP